MTQPPNAPAASPPDSWVESIRIQLERFRLIRLPLLIAIHLVLFVGIYFLALYVRFESILPENPRHLQVLPLVLIVKFLSFSAFKTFHGWWRHVTFSDLVLLAKATIAAVAAFFLIDYLFLPAQISRAVIIIDGAFTITILCALRSVWRSWDERLIFGNRNRNMKRALIIGEDFETARLSHLINSRHQMDAHILGLVSKTDNRHKRFGQLRVVGALEDLKSLCKELRINVIYIPNGALLAKEVRELIDDVRDSNVSVNVVPSLNSILQGGTSIPIREVSFEDLLRRDPVKLDQQMIHGLLEGKRILVTGAGGSIGSELCRQIIKFNPSELLLLGRGENRVYQIEKELHAFPGGSGIKIILATITDRDRIRQIFRTHRPQVVFHAAAHKHVPIVEGNVGEAVINNVYGTKVVADACDEFGVSQFVMISTDKAVNPTSVMGCTKQLAERYCLALGSHSKTSFVVTRFGNVLGSAGSVVPLFKKQIREGGPLTVTDPRMTRFFMTIPEAAQLVVQAGAMGQGGEIFVLEMGKPVKIVDLARDLIRLAGLSPDAIDIEFTGVRKGEKLYEELYYHDEQSLPTKHEKILTAYQRPFDFTDTSDSTNELVEIAYTDDRTIKAKLKELIPEFDQSLTDSRSQAEEVVNS